MLNMEFNMLLVVFTQFVYVIDIHEVWNTF